METSRVTLITLMCVVLYSQMMCGAEVEMRVSAGDNVTLYCDCVWKIGFNVVWFRNCSHQHQPPLILSAENQIRDIDNQEMTPRYSFVWNRSNSTHDLLVENITVADLGLYYCALSEKNISKDHNGVIRSNDVYHYGNRSTRLSLQVSPCVSVSTTTSSPPVSDCSVCWKLLISVCPVCVLLSSLLSSSCVYCFCTKTNTVPKASDERDCDQRENQKGTHDESLQAGGDDVCYASLDILSREDASLKKKKKKKRSQSSDFSMYSEVRTNRTEL